MTTVSVKHSKTLLLTKILTASTLALVLGFGVTTPKPADARVFVSAGFGFGGYGGYGGGYGYRHGYFPGYYGYGGYYDPYYSYPAYYPAPVVYAQPTIVQPTYVQPAYAPQPTYAAPPPGYAPQGYQQQGYQQQGYAPQPQPPAPVSYQPRGPSPSLAANQTSATFTDGQGRTCRQYQTTSGDGPPQGTACLMADGEWHTVN